MSWRERYSAGSFRGVPFLIEEARTGGGRRVALHDVPDRVVPIPDDTGRRPRRFQVTAVVVGDDHDQVASILQDKLEQEGPGELIHPWMGRRLVLVDGEYSRRESTSDGGKTEFEIPFIEVGETTAFRSEDFQQGIDDASTAVRDAAGADAEDGIATVGWPEYVREATSGAVASIGAVLKPLRFIQAQQTQVAIFSNQVTSLINNATSLAVAPALLATQVFETVEQIGRLGMNSVDAFYVYRTVFGLEPQQVGGTSAAALAADRNAQLCIDLARLAALYSAAQEAINATWPSTLALDEARRDLEAQIEALQSRCSDEVYQSLEDLRVAIAAALPATIERSNELRSVTLSRATPSIVLAYRFHDDIEREEEIVRRNGVDHPLFVSARTPVLVAIDG